MRLVVIHVDDFAVVVNAKGHLQEGSDGGLRQSVGGWWVVGGLPMKIGHPKGNGCWTKNRDFYPPNIIHLFIGFSLINHPFWGTTIVGNTQMNHLLTIDSQGLLLSVPGRVVLLICYPLMKEFHAAFWAAYVWYYSTIRGFFLYLPGATGFSHLVHVLGVTQMIVHFIKVC